MGSYAALKKMRDAQQCLDEYRTVFAHVHMTDPREGASDACLSCGLDLRDPIHSEEYLEKRRERDDRLRKQGRARHPSYQNFWS